MAAPWEAMLQLNIPNLLNMQKVVAFVPQYSIDPDVVQDRRYAEFFDAGIHQDMQIQADEVDASREYIIVYDPYFVRR